MSDNDLALLLAFCALCREEGIEFRHRDEPEHDEWVVSDFLSTRSQSEAQAERFWGVVELKPGRWLAFGAAPNDPVPLRMLSPAARPTRELAEADGIASGLPRWQGGG